MEKNLENPKHGFCSEQIKLCLTWAVFQNSVRIKRNISFSEDVFLRFVVPASFQIILIAMPNFTYSYWMLMKRYFRYDLVDQFVMNNPILWWESLCNHICCNFSLLSVYLNEKRDQRGGSILVISDCNFKLQTCVVKRMWSYCNFTQFQWLIYNLRFLFIRLIWSSSAAFACG